MKKLIRFRIVGFGILLYFCWIFLGVSFFTVYNQPEGTSQNKAINSTLEIITS